MVTIIFLLSAIIQDTNASAITVRAEGHLGTNLAQEAIIFHKKTVTRSRNSNIVCGPAKEVVLGIFEAPLTKHREVVAKLIEQTYIRLKKGSTDVSQKKKTIPFSNDLHWMLGEFDVTGEPANETQVQEVLREACNENDWKPDKAASVSLTDPTHALISVISGPHKGKSEIKAIKTLGCHNYSSSTLLCPIPGWGSALLLRP